MKIVVTRETIGRLLGVLIVTVTALVLSYLATAWVWWQANPGDWSEGARATQLGLAVVLLLIRSVSITVAPSSGE